jgi:hypothetical protein
MKLKLDAIQAKYMPLNMQGQQVQQPVLKIVAGDFEATTSRSCLRFTHQAFSS